MEVLQLHRKTHIGKRNWRLLKYFNLTRFPDKKILRKGETLWINFFLECSFLSGAVFSTRQRGYSTSVPHSPLGCWKSDNSQYFQRHEGRFSRDSNYNQTKAQKSCNFSWSSHYVSQVKTNQGKQMDTLILVIKLIPGIYFQTAFNWLVWNTKPWLSTFTPWFYSHESKSLDIFFWTHRHPFETWP